MRKSIIATILALSFLYFTDSTWANVTVTPATGGTNISADKAANALSPAWTSLGQIIIDEVSNANKNDFGAGTGVKLILKTPAGFEFNTSVTPNSTFTTDRDISSASISFSNSTTMAITLTVIGTGNIDKLTIGNTTGVQVRPISGTPLVSGQIYRPPATNGGGNAIISGITTTTDTTGSGGTSFGSLSEIVGNAYKLAFTTQPGAATEGLQFGIQPIVKSQDQFGGFSTSSLPANLNVTNTLTSGTGTLSGKTFFDIGASAGQGTVTFTNLQINLPGPNKQLTASATGLVSANSQIFSVNAVPSISSISNQVTNEDTTTAAIPFTVGDLETPATNLILFASSLNTNLVPIEDLVFGGSGTNRTLTITPATNQFGTNTITIFVSDGIVTNSTSFGLTINSVNDAPSLNAISNLNISEDSGTNIVSLNGITFGASNEIQTLTLSATSSNLALFSNPTVTYTSPNTSGTLSFTPLTNAFGTSLITVTAQDNGGTANGGTNVFIRTFLVTVNPINDLPTISQIGDQIIDEDNSTSPLPFIISDVETVATTLTVAGASSNTNLIPNANIVFGGSSSNRTVTITPATNQFGSATITISVGDGSTNVNEIFVVTVNPINDMPTISAISNQITNEDTALSAISFTVSDVETAATSLFISSDSSNTNLVPNANVVLGGSEINRNVTITPAANQFGVTTITISVSDGVATTNRVFQLTINSVNDIPTLNSINDITVDQDSGTNVVNFSGISSGASNESQTFTVSAISSNPALIPNPTVNYLSPNAAGTLSFAPLANTNGIATITVTVQDNGGTANGGSNSVSRQFFITVLPRTDLGISQIAAPNPVPLGADLTFTLTITNNGPFAANNIVVTNELPANADFVSTTTSQGSFTNQGSSIIYNLGSITNHGIATINVTVRTSGNGTVTNTASVTTSAFDPNSTNNSSSAVATIGPPNFLFQPGTLVAETCVNGAIDPAESVTVNFALKNVGTANTTNLVATLRNTGGVTAAGAPQNYGVLVTNGAFVSRPFTLVPIGTCGGTFTATLQLQDGAKNLGIVSFTFTLGTSVTNTVQLTKTNSISIPFGTATPYPATNVVSGLLGPILKVAVRLNNLTHGQPDDLDILLVSPNGESTYLMSDSGGGLAVNNVTLTFDDTAATGLPDNSQIIAGTYKPSNFATAVDSFAAPAPTNLYVTNLSVFNGGSPNGEWQLYIMDDFSSFSGSMAGGWTLILTTLEPACCVPTNSVNLAVAVSDSPDPVIVGNDLVYTIFVTNFGPATATGVTVTNPLPQGVSFASAVPSQGTATNSSGIVICNLGTLASNATANFTLTVRPISAGITITNLTTVRANQPEYAAADNSFETLTVVSVPTISIGTASVIEGTTNAVFNLALSSDSSQTISVNYATADDTTTAGSDYFSTNGIVTFTPGQTNKTVTVSIKGDSLNEATEFFFVNLSNPVNVSFAEGQGVGMITDDDPLPSLSISDVTITEENSGTTNINFVVSLFPVSGQSVTVNYSTADGSAIAGIDYESANGTITFDPGQANQIVSVVVKNELTNEVNENFFVNLTNQVNAGLSDAQGIGTILNNDFLANISTTGFALTGENCAPTNGLIDPNETVTVNFSLRNVSTGTARTTNLVATLLPVGGITSPSSAQNYGALSNPGPAVARSFTFGVSGSCGSTISAVFQLQDGTNNLGTVTNFLLLGKFSLETNSFSDLSGIGIANFGGATPYPSVVNVSGITGGVTQVTITLTNLSHTYPSDLDILLVAPNGENVLLMSDTGLGAGISTVTLTFDDTATNSLPETGQIVSGKFKPTNIGENEIFSPPAPGEPYGALLSAFNGMDPNGAWSLYVFDDTGGDAGTLGGWKLTLTSFSEPICCGVNSSADLAVSISDSPDPVTVGSNVVFTIAVTNRGPYAASGVSLIDPLPAGADFVSATSTVGSCTNFNGTVLCDLGSMTNGARATITLTVTTTVAGTMTNSVSVFSNTSDPITTNDNAVALTTVRSIVSLAVIDANASETGPDTGTFTVTRTGTVGPLTVNYTVAGTASTNDYTPLSGSVIISNGMSSAQIVLMPVDDFLVEPTETVILNLAASPFYTINGSSNSATANITDNDVQSILLSTNALAVTEGDTNSFTVRLTAQPTNTVIVTTAFTGGDTNLIVSSGASINFTATNWNIPQPVGILATQDVDIVNGAATVTVSSAGLSSQIVAVTEIDNDVVTIIVSTNLISVPEGSTNSFAVQLSAQPTNPVTVTTVRTSGDTNLNIFSGASRSFTTNNWNVPQSIVLSDGMDLNAFNGQAIFTLSSTNLPNVTVTAAEIDNDQQLIVLSTNSLTVTEGATNTFTVRLSAQPTSNVVVATGFTSGDTNLSVAIGTNLTFTSANWDIAQTVGIRAAMDNDVANGQASFAISASGWTNQILTVTEVDNDVLDFLLSTNSIVVPEGGTNIFTIRLTAEPSTNVVINTAFSSGDTNLIVASGGALTFNSINWNTPQNVALSASQDNDAVNGQATFTVSSSGLTNQFVTATEIDNDALNIISSTNLINVPEGDTNSFTVRLGAQPTNNLTIAITRSGDTNLNILSATNLFFDSTNWNVAQVVMVNAAEDNDAINSQGTFVLSTAGLSNVNVVVIEVENDTQTLLLSTNLVSVVEGNSNSFTVRLTAEPTNSVSINIARTSGDTNLSLTSSATLAFNSTNWDLPQTVSLVATQDDNAVNGQAIFTVSSTGLSNVTVTVTEIENDTLMLLASTNSLVVPEGATNTFTIRLTAQPTSNVVVATTFTSGDTNLIVASGSNLTFNLTNWNVPQSVGIRATQDNDAVNSSATFTISSAGLTNLTVIATESDNDVLNFLLSTNSFTVAEGGTNFFTIRLTAEPTNNVVVNTVRSSGDTNLNVTSGGALTFNSTNWNLTQNVALAASQDNDIVNGLANFTVSSSGLTNQFVTSTEIDNDTLNLILSTNAIEIPEGTTVNLEVHLSAEPASVVTVTVTNFGDAGLVVIGETNIFFNSMDWNIPQTVILGAFEDLDAINSQGTFVFASVGLTNVSVVATEIENDTQSILVSDEFISVPEGNSNFFTVRLTAQITNTVLVSILENPGDTNLSLASAATLTFNSTNWNIHQPVWLSATDDDDAVVGQTDFVISSPGLADQILPATEIENDILTLQVTNLVFVIEGGSNVFSVQLTAQPTNNVNVAIAFSGDSDISLDSTSNLIFSATNWSAPQAVVVSTTEDADALNGHATFVFSAVGFDDQIATVSEIDNDVGIVVSTNLLMVTEGQSNIFAVRLNVPPDDDVPVTISFTESDPDISISTNTFVFNSNNWDIVQTVTVTATEDNDNTNGQTMLSITSPGLTAQNITLIENDNDMQSMVLCPGENASFQLTPPGAGPFIYAWFQNGSVIVGETNNSLAISNVAFVDAGTYSVVFTNGAETITNFASLTVSTNTSATALTSLTNCPGDDVSFSTTPNGAGPFSFVWRKDGVAIANQTNSTLNLLSVVATNAGTYSVIVSGSCNGVTNSATLTVSTNTAATSLTSLIECPGDTATFTTTPTGTGPFSFVWLKNGIVLGNQTNAALNLLSVVATNAGAYSVIVSGSCNSITNSATLIVSTNTSATLLTSLTNCPGDDVSFSTAPSGTGPFAFVWRKNGIALSNQTNATLSLLAVVATDAGAYSVIVSGSCNSVTNSASLTINTNTSATSLTGLIRCPGDNATFSTTPGGTGPFTFVWRQNGVALTNQTNASLNLFSVLATNAGTYSVEVSGACNSVTNSATLTVNSNTSATSLTNLIHCPGDNATFSTTPSGTGPFTFVWRKDGIALSNQTNSTLNLLSVVATNAGTYSVEVLGTCNSVTNSASLTINTNSSATALTSLIRCPGNTATFATTPSGTGPFAFLWRKDGIILPNQTNATLNLISVVATNAGNYSVEVYGDCNSVTNSATLMVNTNTSATALTSLIRCPGENATFSTTPSGTGPFAFVWRRNGVALSNQTNATLDLLSVVATNAGTYSVIVSGNCNNVTNSATLTVNTNTSATALTSLIRCPGTSATFSTTPSGTGPFAFLWRKDGIVLPNQTNATLNLISVVATNAGNYSVEIYGDCNSVTNSASLTVNTNISATALTSLIRCPGNNANFSTTPSGTGPFAFLWRHNGIALASQTNATLNLISVVATNAGTYSVIVSGNCNSITNSATLTVTTNTSATALTSLIRCQGNNATFSTTPSGTGPFTFVWRQDGIALGNQTNATLNLISVVATNAGNYSVEVSGACNSVTNSASLTVNINTSATTLTSLVRCPGENATFSTTPSGTGPLTFVWRKNGVAIANQTNSSLNFISVAATNAGNYSVEISGACNSVTNSASLTVNTNTSATALTSLIRCPGDNAIFSTTPSGTGPFVFAWRKDGIALPDETNATLNLVSVVATNAGSYSVEVSGSCNSVTNSATLTVSTNTSATALTSLIECPGDNVSFSTTPSGTGPFSFVWRRNGVVIPNQTNNSLSLISVVATNAGTYAVEVSGNCNSATNSATLVVNTNTFATTLANLIRCPGESAMFSTTPGGTGPFSFVWRKNGGVIANETNSSLSLLSVDATDAGIYAVEVSGGCNSVTNLATLVVNANTSATALTNLVRCPGDSAMFSTTPDGTAPFSYVWRKDGIVIENQTNATLNLISVAATNAGNYSVEVLGVCNSVTNSASLTINTNTSATALTSLIRCPGDDATFSTTPNGTGPFSIVWRKDGVALNNQTNATLNLLSVVATNAGTYSVIVSGSCNSVTNSATLALNSPISISPLTNATNFPGNTVTFNTSVSGTGPFAYVWKKGDVIISGVTNNTLTISPVSNASAGVYTVEVTGACGTATSSATLVVAAQIPQITAIAFNGNNVLINFSSRAGKFYRVECVDAFSTDSWRTVADNITGTGEIIQAVDFGGAGKPSRFYRIREFDSIINPHLTSLAFTNGDVIVSFDTVAGSYYRVERIDDLGSNLWTPVVDVVVGTGGIMSVTDVGGAGRPHRFYRVLLLSNSYVQSLIISTNRVSIGEGSTTNFAVKLAIAPTTNVLVTVARTIGDSDLVVIGGNTLTFTPTNWEVPQTVSLHANADADTLNGEATFVISSSGLANQFLTATESDNLQIQIRITSLAFTNNDVIISFDSTAGSHYRVERTDDLGSNLWTPVVDVVVGTGGIISVKDIDGAGRPHRFYRVRLLSSDSVQTLIISTNQLTVTEGSVTNFTVRLAIAPTTNVLVTTVRSSGDSDLVVSGGNALTFTPINWNTPQPISLNANADADTANGQATFAISSSGLADQFVFVTEVDNLQTELRIMAIQLVGTNVVVSFGSTLGNFYSLEYSVGLGTPWLTATNNIAGSGGVVQATDRGGATQIRRFYRMKQLP